MEKVRSKDGTAIAFDRSGSGPAVILVDGALCYRGVGPMAALTELLAPRFSVIKYDRRGRGDSSDTQPYAVEREIEDLDALIQAAGGSALVYGGSSGAALALEAAIRGLKIEKLAVFEAPYMLEGSRPRPPVDYVDEIKRLVAANRRGDAVAYFMTAAVGVPEEAVAPMRGSPVWPMFEDLAHTLAYDGAILGDYDPPFERLACIDKPTLVMDGGASPDWMRQSQKAIADAIPGSQYCTLDGQTHEVSADALAPVLVDFFAE